MVLNVSQEEVRIAMEALRLADVPQTTDSIRWTIEELRKIREEEKHGIRKRVSARPDS
jgi:hypothetical protein